MPSAARAWPSISAYALDMLGVCLVVGAMLWSLAMVWSLALGVLVGIVYRAVARAGGRQTFGQAVFHLLTVSQDAGPASFAQSLRRTLGETLWLPWACIDASAALGRLDRASESYEVRLD